MVARHFPKFPISFPSFQEKPRIYYNINQDPIKALFSFELATEFYILRFIFFLGGMSFKTRRHGNKNLNNCFLSRYEYKWATSQVNSHYCICEQHLRSLARTFCVRSHNYMSRVTFSQRIKVLNTLRSWACTLKHWQYRLFECLFSCVAVQICIFVLPRQRMDPIPSIKMIKGPGNDILHQDIPQSRQKSYQSSQ